MQASINFSWIVEMRKPEYLEYKNKNNQTRYKPSIELIKEMENRNEGFCIACGEIAYGVEPDASGYECECCDERKVFGSFTLALNGICF